MRTCTVSNVNEVIDMLEAISDEMIENEWRNELGVNEGDAPIRPEGDFPNDFMLPDFEMEEDELLINRGE